MAWDRSITGMLPEAEIAFLDEVFLGSTAILNTLLGLLTQQEATRATNLVQGVSGVQKIVKLFEYID